MAMWLAPSMRLAGNAAWCPEEQSGFFKAPGALFPVSKVGAVVQTHDEVEGITSDIVIH